ncbi:hypothetical protein Tco_0293788 [Tanacetum coccineum]
MELHDVSYGIEYVAQPLMLFSLLKIDFCGLGVLSPLDTAYCASFLLWSLVSASTGYVVSSLMDMAYWSSE